MTPAEYYADLLSRTEPVKAALAECEAQCAAFDSVFGFGAQLMDLARDAIEEMLLELGHQMTIPLSTCGAATELDYYEGIPT